jgi:hypothetical protein
MEQYTPKTRNPQWVNHADSDECERKIESMAEDLVARMAKLHTRLESLALSALSQKEKAKLRAWADKENEELLRLKAAIREQKQSYIKNTPSHHLARLANHHPVWRTHYDIYMDQIQAATLTRQGDDALVRCTLKSHVLTPLRIFCDAGDGKVLCVNSDRGIRYEGREPGRADSVRWWLLNDTFYGSRRNIFRMVERIRAQWVFTGDSWGLEDRILWLAFGGQRVVGVCP